MGSDISMYNGKASIVIFEIVSNWFEKYHDSDDYQ